MPKVLLSILLISLLIPALVAAKKKPKKVDRVVGRIPINPDTGLGSYIHGCCDCELRHRVTVQVVHHPDGRIEVVESWAVLPEMTRIERIKRWGADYLKQFRHPFGAEFREPQNNQRR